MKIQRYHIFCLLGIAGILFLNVTAIADIMKNSGESLFNEYLILLGTLVLVIVFLLKRYFFSTIKAPDHEN